MMSIQIQVINSVIDQSLRQRLRRRVRKLETFHDKIIAMEILLKRDNSNKENGYHAEIRLIIKGYDLFGRSKAGSFEKATALVIESLRKRLRKKKTTKLKIRRGMQAIF